MTNSIIHVSFLYIKVYVYRVIHSKPYLHTVCDGNRCDVVQTVSHEKLESHIKSREKSKVLASHTWIGVGFFCRRGFIYRNSLRKLWTVPSGVSSRGWPRQKEGTARRSGSLISSSTSMRLTTNDEVSWK